MLTQLSTVNKKQGPPKDSSQASQFLTRNDVRCVSNNSVSPVHSAMCSQQGTSIGRRCDSNHSARARMKNLCLRVLHGHEPRHLARRLRCLSPDDASRPAEVVLDSRTKWKKKSSTKSNKLRLDQRLQPETSRNGLHLLSPVNLLGASSDLCLTASRKYSSASVALPRPRARRPCKEQKHHEENKSTEI